MINKKAWIEALASIGINLDGDKKKLTIEQVGELQKILKEKYDIDVVIKTDFEEMLEKTVLEQLTMPKEPKLEFCGNPPDGKARRRERRRLERLQKKRKR